MASNVTNLIEPSFKKVASEIRLSRADRQISRAIKKENKFMQDVTEVSDFSVTQPLREGASVLICKILKLKGVSKNPKVAEIEKELGKKGVFVRFNNNEKMAHLVRRGIKKVENAGYELPNQIIVVKPKIIPGCGGYSFLFRQKTAKKAPILISDILQYIPSCCNKHLSTRGKSHTVIHEIGHWLHLQTKPNNDICKKIWATADKNLIREEVSSEAIRRADGLEFVAEVFAGLVNHKKYSKHVMDIYHQLKGPMPKNKLFVNV